MFPKLYHFRDKNLGNTYLNYQVSIPYFLRFITHVSYLHEMAYISYKIL